jgi:hypothetical protein
LPPRGSSRKSFTLGVASLVLNWLAVSQLFALPDDGPEGWRVLVLVGVLLIGIVLFIFACGYYARSKSDSSRR